MSRLLLVPQYPTKLRYQEWWFEQLPEGFSNYFDEVKIIGKHVNAEPLFGDNGFAPIVDAIEYETYQICHYIDLPLRKDDVLLLCDLSYPGLFAQVLFHKRPSRCFAICHGTSLNNYDYYQKDRYMKFPIETSVAKLFDSIFVASQYHKDKLHRWPNVTVQPFPMPPFEPAESLGRNNAIVSVARDTIQKRTKKIEKMVEWIFDCKIVRPNVSSWSEYYSFLADSMMVLITAKEETYGYQVVDALKNGCIPIAPNLFSYPELLPKEYLYRTFNDIAEIGVGILSGDLIVPKLLTQQAASVFYRNLSNIMQS